MTCVVSIVLRCCVQHNHFRFQCSGKNDNFSIISCGPLYPNMSAPNHNEYKPYDLFSYNKFPQTEPISGTAPKVPLVLKFVRYTVDIKNTVAILCPAQAYPVPNFRYVTCVMIPFIKFVLRFQINWPRN